MSRSRDVKSQRGIRHGHFICSEGKEITRINKKAITCNSLSSTFGQVIINKGGSLGVSNQGIQDLSRDKLFQLMILFILKFSIFFWFGTFRQKMGLQ